MEKSEKNIIEQIFEVTPKQWGLRGDPYLWDDLKLFFLRNKTPQNVDEFENSFRLAFKELTGKELIRNSEIFIEKYSKGGMSSGMVYTDFWIEKGLPFLIDRFEIIVK